MGLALAGLVGLSPVLAVVAMAVWMADGRPIFFRQLRPGRGGWPFTLVKFRTMSDARDAAGVLLPDEARLTKIGWVLRSWSLDELPQLWNVLRGDMSMVGPRPLLMQYLPRYSARQARRHEVRPGLTGFAQVRGRNALGWQRRLELDVRYVERISLVTDMKILVWTIWRVLSRKGISERGRTTKGEFMGNGPA